jgi:hypothetical protein
LHAFGTENRVRICWFNDNRPALVGGNRVRDASKAFEQLPSPGYPFPPKGDPLIAHLDRLKPAILAATAGAPSFPISEVRFLGPVAAPTKIIGTPTNYWDHITKADRQRDVLGRRYSGSKSGRPFLRATSALVGPGQVVRLRFSAARRDRTRVIVLGSADNARRFHNPALADPVGAKEYLDREWSHAVVTSRYEWLFTYDVLGAEI